MADPGNGGPEPVVKAHVLMLTVYSGIMCYINVVLLT